MLGKHKTKSYGVQLHDRNAFKENLDLLYNLQECKYKKYYIIHVVTLNHRYIYNCKTRNMRLYQAIKKLKKIPAKILIRHHGSNNYFRK